MDFIGIALLFCGLEKPQNIYILINKKSHEAVLLQS